MESNELKILIRAYNQFSETFSKFRNEFQRTNRTQTNFKETTVSVNRAVGTLTSTIGNVAVFEIFRRALMSVIDAGKQLELQFKQVNAVSGDMSDTIKNSALTNTDSYYAPSKMAGSFYEMASAGLETNEMLNTLNPALDFATATVINTTESMNAGISTIKAFNMEFTESNTVFDAFTEAVSSSSLKGEDFVQIMANAGSVAKMANQDFRELIAAAAAMKNAGVSAMSAGTSIKQSLLQLINPSKEAKKIMNALGVEVYDSSGRMKQWSSIVKEFEKSMQGLTDEQKNNYLATIFGSDGIRAMTTSMNTGSETLSEYVTNMKMAEGKTEDVAGIMKNTFSGALQKAIGNLERLKAGIFEKLEPALTSLITSLDKAISWFVNLDDSVKNAILILIGAGGFFVAITTTISIIQTLMSTLKSATLAVNAFKIATGPLGLIFGGLSIAASGLIAFSNASKKAREESQKFIDETSNRIQGLDNEIRTTDNLINKYEYLKNKTKLTVDEKKELHEIEVELAKLYPETAEGIDEQNREYTTQIGLVKDLRDEKVKLKQEELELFVAKGNSKKQEWKKEIDNLEEQKKSLEERRDLIKELHEREKEIEQIMSKIYSDKSLNDSENELLDKIRAAGQSTTSILSYLKSDEELNTWQNINEEIIDIEKAIREFEGNLEKYYQAKERLDNMASIDNPEEDFVKRLKSYSPPSVVKKKEDLTTGPEGGSGTDPAADAYNKRLSTIEHYYNIGKTNLQEYINSLKKIKSDYNGFLNRNYEDRYSIEERIYNLEKENFSKYISELEGFSKEVLSKVKDINTEVQFLESKGSVLGANFNESKSQQDFIVYVDILNEKIKKYKDKQDELHIATEKLRGKRDELNKVLADNIKKYGENSYRAKELKSELDKMESKINENSRTWWDWQGTINNTASEIERAKDTLTDTVDEMEDKLTEAFEKEYTSKLDSEIEGIDSRIKDLNDELDALNERYKEEDYLSAENERQDKLRKLSSRYEELRKNDSQWGAKKRQDIAAEMAQIEEEQQKAKTEFERDEERNRIRDKISMLEEEKERVTEHYNSMIDNISNMFEEETRTIPQLLKQFEAEYFNAGNSLGQQFVNGLKAQIEKAREAWYELNGITGSNINTGNNTSLDGGNDNRKTINNYGPLLNIGQMNNNNSGDGLESADELSNSIQDALYTLGA